MFQEIPVTVVAQVVFNNAFPQGDNTQINFVLGTTDRIAPASG